MLQRCEDTNLVLNWEKCHFMVKEGIVLGHKISKSGIEVDKAKVDVIAKLPHPTTVKGIRSFLGHTGFYRRFIQDFSKIARPMTHLLVKAWTKLIQFMHTTMVPEQVKTMKIQAGIQVSRPGELKRQLQLWKRFGRLYSIVFVLVRNILLLQNGMPLFYANGERYTTTWSEVDQVFIPINETGEHWCLAQFYIMSGEVMISGTHMTMTIDS
ncbi:hypothetical protein Tco_0779273 [Tanacetum coccineum]